MLLLAWVACLSMVPVLSESSPVDGCDGHGKCDASQPAVPMEKIVGSDSTSPRSSRCGSQCHYFMWTQWSVCTCGSQLRSRAARSLGTGCSRSSCPRVQTQKCSSYPEYCKMSEWSHWSSCANGARKRWRTIIQPETCRSTDGVGFACRNNLVETRSCEKTSYTYEHEQLGHNVKRSLSEEPGLSSTNTPNPSPGDLKESGDQWWIYAIVAVVCMALLAVGVGITVHCIRKRNGRYVIKSGQPRVSVCEENVGVVRYRSSPAGSAFHNCVKKPKKRRSSRDSGFNFAVEMHDSSNCTSSASSEAGDPPFKGGRYGISNPMADLEEVDEILEDKDHKDNRQRSMSYDSQTRGEQLVCYFDNDDRYSVMQSNTEDREEFEESMMEKCGMGCSYQNPLCSFSDSVHGKRPDTPEVDRHMGDGVSDSSVVEDQKRETVVPNINPYCCDGRGSMPPADGDSEASSPRDEEDQEDHEEDHEPYRPISRGHGIWQYSREVTPDGKRYTKIKATKLHLPSCESALATNV